MTAAAEYSLEAGGGETSLALAVPLRRFRLEFSTAPEGTSHTTHERRLVPYRARGRCPHEQRSRAEVSRAEQSRGQREDARVLPWRRRQGQVKAMSLKVKMGGGGGIHGRVRRRRRGSRQEEENEEEEEDELEMQGKDIAAAAAPPPPAPNPPAPPPEAGGHEATTSGGGGATAAAAEEQEEESDHEWVAEPEPGVLMTLVARPDGTNHLRRIRFSEELFDGHRAAQRWWADNYDSIVELYSVVQPEPEHAVEEGGSNDADSVPATPCQSEDDDHRRRRQQGSDSASNFSGPSSGSGSGSRGGSASTVGSPILGLVTAAGGGASATQAKHSPT
uniref:BRX domain-containing protein n=1 Tax=Oryza brachyantha TaxID=4533 RepID=J3LYV2_ORYBR